MTKAEIVTEIVKSTGVERTIVLTVVEEFMESVRGNVVKRNNVYLRGFGSFITKKRARKTARNITKGTTVIVPEHEIPAFKPAKSFTAKVK